MTDSERKKKLFGKHVIACFRSKLCEPQHLQTTRAEEGSALHPINRVETP